MTTLPAWTDAARARKVGEPFRSDGDFWASLAASADALISLAAAVAVAIVLVLTGEGPWSVLPFAVPAALAVRAGLIARASSHRSRERFDDRRAWREAERTAVATGFFSALGRRRGSKG